MNKLLEGFHRLNVFGQFMATLAFLSVACLVIGAAEMKEHSSFTIAVNFGPLACVAALFVIFFRVLNSGQR